MKDAEGFIALISVIIITAVITAIVFALSFMSFFLRTNILESEYKDQSIGRAEACVYTTILKLTLDQSYSGNETEGSVPCFIRPIPSGPFPKDIEVEANVNNFHTNLRVTVSAPPTLSIISWEEIGDF